MTPTNVGADFVPFGGNQIGRHFPDIVSNCDDVSMTESRSSPMIIMYVACNLNCKIYTITNRPRMMRAKISAIKELHTNVTGMPS